MQENDILVGIINATPEIPDSGSRGKKGWKAIGISWRITAQSCGLDSRRCEEQDDDTLGKGCRLRSVYPILAQIRMLFPREPLPNAPCHLAHLSRFTVEDARQVCVKR